MKNEMEQTEKQMHYEEVKAWAMNGMLILILNTALIIGAIFGFINSMVRLASNDGSVGSVVLMVIFALYAFILGPILYAGLKILKPNDALVLTLFGKYYGTLKGAGFFYVNPFVAASNPAGDNQPTVSFVAEQQAQSGKSKQSGMQVQIRSKKVISLKAMTLSNEKQKINDKLGNPIIIGIVVIWRVVNTAKAVFNVDNYVEYLSIQCDSALRNIVRLYPYDSASEDNETTLRGSSLDVAARLKEEIQMKVDIAGLEIAEARITHLAYAPEIASAMLQRQQATAIIEARQMIVEGAVGMVEMALNKLNDNDIVHLDEERKAAMVSNLLVVLCSNKDPQPIVNSGSLY